MEQSRDLRRVTIEFGVVRSRNARRPSACVSTRGPGSPRIAPGRDRSLPARGTQFQPQKASTLTLNAVATRGTAAAAPLRREEKWHGPYRGGALHIQPKLPNRQASSQPSPRDVGTNFKQGREESSRAAPEHAAARLRHQADRPERLGEVLRQARALALRDLAARHVLLGVPARSIAVARLGPNGLEIEKETTHVIVRWTRVASMA